MIVRGCHAQAFDALNQVITFSTQSDKTKQYQSTLGLASFPALPCFCSSVCIDNNTWKQKSSENVEDMGAFIT